MVNVSVLFQFSIMLSNKYFDFRTSKSEERIRKELEEQRTEGMSKEEKEAHVAANAANALQKRLGYVAYSLPCFHNIF
jgi:hypothetical protein